MNAKEIQLAILRITSLTELKEINATLASQWKAVQRIQVGAFNRGDKVTFTAKGVTYSGRVEKVNQKTVTVFTDRKTTWRVSPTLLSKVA